MTSLLVNQAGNDSEYFQFALGPDIREIRVVWNEMGAFLILSCRPLEVFLADEKKGLWRRKI
ncbi:MAG: hypothetical protein DID89_2727546439 [Candidatus Nitrotoga sp. CP45]|nr:MAG: hypothetical protein DID89_2727546439 [Candidatus Nitrotoga sp. CP45]